MGWDVQCSYDFKNTFQKVFWEAKIWLFVDKILTDFMKINSIQTFGSFGNLGSLNSDSGSGKIFWSWDQKSKMHY